MIFSWKKTCLYLLRNERFFHYWQKLCSYLFVSRKYLQYCHLALTVLTYRHFAFEQRNLLIWHLPALGQHNNIILTTCNVFLVLLRCLWTCEFWEVSELDIGNGPFLWLFLPRFWECQLRSLIFYSPLNNCRWLRYILDHIQLVVQSSFFGYFDHESAFITILEFRLFFFFLWIIFAFAFNAGFAIAILHFFFSFSSSFLDVLSFNNQKACDQDRNYFIGHIQKNLRN